MLLWFIAFSGFIGITALILPGISGSFLLLILGQYESVTGALKNPFKIEHIMIIVAFCIGAFLSLISVSRLLGTLFKRYPNSMISLLTGLLLGSLGKVWPWKEVTKSIVIRGKEKILETNNFFPEVSWEMVLAVIIIILGVISILLVDHFGKNARSL